MKQLHKRVLQLEKNSPCYDPRQWDLSALTNEDLETMIEIEEISDEERSDTQKQILERLLKKVIIVF